MPRSLAVLEARLRQRGKDSPEVIQRRLSVARQDMGHWNQFDYVVVSDTVAEDLRRMRVIHEAERLRQERVAPALESML
jgi:guanylate kinase